MIRIQMVKITTEQFAILSDVPLQGDFQVNLQLTIKHSVELKRIGIKSDFSVIHKNKKHIVLSVFCEFAIYPDDWESAITDGTITIPKSTIEYFVVQTIGTARGILHTKTEGTPFNNIILPSFNVTQFIKNDYVAKLS